MLTVEQIVKQLQDRSPRKVANKTGLTESTVARIRDGKNKPSADSMERLSDYLEGK